MDNAVQTISYIQTLGGLGLFLLGMIIMTDALRAWAGDSIRAALMRFTRSPLSGALTGAASTAILQSSSATTVAAVGFVGAGLMSFSSALGIVFGANLGTTITGWIVTLVGFKLKLVTLMLPCIFLGTVMRLMFSGRTATSGLVLAGFGLIFVGIDQMQDGMSGMRSMLDQFQLPGDTHLNRLKLVGIGAVFTIVTQSSSAGVAAVLTALFTDAITLGQGLALVIGMDIGTTVTAVLATLGGSVGSRRTGYSHFVYNLLTGVTAFLLISPYLALWETLAPQQLLSNAQVVLVAFHSSFNLLGVILILPFTHQFAELMKRIVPDHGASYTASLDNALLAEPSVALRAVVSSIVDEFSSLLGHTFALLHEHHADKRVDLQRLQEALDQTHEYVDKINLESKHHGWLQLVSIFHILDHLQRLHERCDEEEARAYRARAAEELADQHRLFVKGIAEVNRYIEAANREDAARVARETNKRIENAVEPIRDQMMQAVANGRINVSEATNSLEAIRWMSRVSYHIAQISHHLAHTANVMVKNKPKVDDFQDA